ncbi:LOW QUALITY PROTEIN: hypothetical protein N5P37_003466, partial [Trichoderma harzianum]
GIAGQAQWEVHVQVRVPGARHVLADAEWLERCTIAGTAGREMAQKWLCSTGRYMDGHPEHLVTWAADFLVPIVDIVLALILDASLRLVPGEENACDWRDEEGKKSLSKNKAINSRHRYYTQLFGGAASLAAEPRHQSRYMHSLDFPNLETFHPGNYSYPALSCCRCKDSSPNNSIHRASIKLLDQFITWMYRLVPHHRQMHAKTACGYCNEPKRSCTHNICIDRDRQALAQSEGPVSVCGASRPHCSATDSIRNSPPERCQKSWRGLKDGLGGLSGALELRGSGAFGGANPGQIGPRDQEAQHPNAWCHPPPCWLLSVIPECAPKSPSRRLPTQAHWVVSCQFWPSFFVSSNQPRSSQYAQSQEREREQERGTETVTRYHELILVALSNRDSGQPRLSTGIKASRGRCNMGHHKAASFGPSELKAMELQIPRQDEALEPCLHGEEALVLRMRADIELLVLHTKYDSRLST